MATQTPDNKNAMTGIKKAAILLLSIPSDTAAEILKNLDRDAVEEVTREIASIGPVPPELCMSVVEEYYNLAVAQS
jgi:flagellar motor switch protein FliG